MHLFNSGDEFLKGIQQNAGDQNLVFLDINMPGKSGLAVLKEMRTMPTLKDIPVVMYSTSNDRNAVMASRAMGANLYVVKPRNFNSLIDIIKKVSTIKWETFVENSTNFVLNQ